MAVPRTSMASLLLAYLSPYPISSSCRNRNNRNTNRNTADDPMLLMSPQIGCWGQIKTRNNHHASQCIRKGKQMKTENNILTRCLGPLFKGSSRVQDVPRSSNLPVNVNVTEIDPPLPVRMTKREEDLYKMSLWERRAGVRELGQLQLKEKRRQMTTLAEICLLS